MIRPITLSDGTTAHIIDGDTHIGMWVEQSGRLDHDQNVLPLLTPYLNGQVIDVGAFIGDHTIHYARHSPNVFAFEPNPVAFECLTRNMEQFDNVTCFMAGCGASIGMATIVQNANAGMATIVQNANAGMATLMNGHGVNVVPVDVLNLGNVSFIKIDAEGWECDVLEGARETIARCRPVMLIEVNDAALRGHGHTPAELIVKLETMRYTIRNIHRGQPMRGPQYDVLCTPLT